MIANTNSSVTSSPMKNGRRPLNGSCVINSMNAGRLVEAGMLDLADAFAGQHLDRRVGQIGADQRHRFIDRLLGVRRQAIVQRQRIALVFQQNAGAEFGDRRKRRFNSLSIGGACVATASLSAIKPHFRAMAADRRILIRRKDQVDIVERTAADQRQRAIGSLQADD